MPKEYNEIDQMKSTVKKVFTGMILGIIVLCIIFGGMYTIGEGERGILLTFGKASQDIKTQGLHFKMPIVQSVIKYEIRTQKYEAAASAASKDLQIVTANIATNFHIQENSVVDLYSNTGLNYGDRIIAPMEQEVVKSITAKYTAEELITKREYVRLEIKQLLHERLLERGIVVEEVSIVNFDFSKSFNDAIEAKVTAEQNALAAKNKLEQIKYEAQQQVESAKGKAEAMNIEAKALRENPDILELRIVEKWSGNLPLVVMSSDNKNGVFDISKYSNFNITK